MLQKLRLLLACQFNTNPATFYGISTEYYSKP